MVKNIKCPHCGQEIEEIECDKELLDLYTDICDTAEMWEYTCDKCNKDFYVYKETKTTRIDVAKKVDNKKLNMIEYKNETIGWR